MVKRITAATLLGLTLVAPVVAAQDDSGVQTKRQAVARLVKTRVRRGVRSGKLSASQAASLRAELKALHAKVQAARKSGQKLTPEFRKELKQSLLKIRRDVKADKGKVFKKQKGRGKK